MGGAPFESIYRHGFVRIAVCIPPVRLGSPATNAAATIRMAGRADEAHAAVVAFPELGLSGYPVCAGVGLPETGGCDYRELLDDI